MALIKCFDCGKEISDRAGTCPFCGCPISELLKSGETVKIKPLPAVNAEWQIGDTPPTPGDQKVSISSNGKTIWEGRAGDVAELSFVQPTNIDIKYHMSVWRNGGKCSGMIDPTRCKTYIIFAQNRALTAIKLELRPVDTLDG
ncbi:MAG: hydrogenase maturation nickel metallochaperone HypA [Oscillospiraceae bacterium]|nr:hydrogenase maturation nickel metallochaperone HypA [Oscillospiraceae bacterium]